MKSVDRIIGMFMGILGLLCFIEAYRRWNGWEGTGLMLLIVGGILIILSVTYIVFPNREAKSIKRPSKNEIHSVMFVGALFFFYFNFMEWIGYPLATWAFLATITKYISPNSRISNILIWTGSVAVGTYIIFKKFLFMYLPAGFMRV